MASIVPRTARRKVSDELSATLEPLIPEFEHSPKGGRRRSVDDRAALNGFMYVLETGVPLEDLPQELGYGSGMACWRRLRDWQAAGVWEKLHLAMLPGPRDHDQIDWGRASIDGASVPSNRDWRRPHAGSAISNHAIRESAESRRSAAATA